MRNEDESDELYEAGIAIGCCMFFLLLICIGIIILLLYYFANI